MNGLNESLERVAIEFPIPIMAEEIDLKLINYLRDKIPCNISYGLIQKEKKIFFRGNIRRSIDSHTMENLTFVITGDYHFGPKLPIFFFNSIKFDILKYNSIERKEQLKLLIDKVTQKTQEYFSKRQK